MLDGKVVKTVRPMTNNEMHQEGWDCHRPLLIEFTDGTLIYASCDEEGNGPGALFARDAEGAFFLQVSPKGAQK